MRTRSGVSTHRVDVIVLERGVEGRREAELAVDLADDGLVTGLDGEDGAGGGEVVLHSKPRTRQRHAPCSRCPWRHRGRPRHQRLECQRSAGRGGRTLEDARRREERVDRGEGGREVVRAGLDGLGAGGLEARRQEGDLRASAEGARICEAHVGGLVERKLGDALADAGRVAGVGEVGLGELLEGLAARGQRCCDRPATDR